MRLGLHAAILGAREQEKRLEVIGNNLANAGTAGFKKDSVHFSDFIYETTYTRMDQGRIRDTGQPFDIALNGKGFFRVQSDQGILYTRAGNLTLSQDGVLVTPEGWSVLGRGGAIQLSGSDVRIERNGQIFDKGDLESSATDGYTLVDSLDLVQFNPTSKLEKVGNGYFKPSDPQAQPEAAEEVLVQQGALEESNFNLVEEMAQMIDTQRVFEAYQKTMQFFYQKDTQLITKLGGP